MNFWHGTRRTATTIFLQPMQQHNFRKGRGFSNKMQELYKGNRSMGSEEINTFATLLRRCKSATDLSTGKQIHDQIMYKGLEKDRYLGNLLIEMYGKCGALHEARAVFDSMDKRNCFSWNMMLAACTQNGEIQQTFQFFQEMPYRDVVSWNSMLAAYIQQGYLDSAFDIFQQMPEPDFVSWNSLITGCIQHGQVNKALIFFKAMPNPDIVSFTAILFGYAQQGHLDEALQLFRKMPSRNVVSWTVMISGYVQQGFLKEALQLFQQMQLQGLTPDRIAFVSILEGCSVQAALAEGKQIHKLIEKYGFHHDVIINTVLINMYGKCGSLVDAHAVFDKMSSRSLVSWNALITVYCQHGHAKKGLDLLKQMKVEGVLADDVTFLTILSACSHTGLTDEGYHLLVSISQDHSISQILEHFNCIIDLLGRASCLDSAEAFINNLPLQASAASWKALLGSCRTHVDVVRGGLAALHALELDPTDSGTYILLSNIHAAVWGVDIESDNESHEEL